MALADVLAAIRRDADEEAARILGEAREEAARIGRAADEEAVRLHGALLREAERERDERMRRAECAARLEARRREREAREAWYQEAVGRVRERLEAARRDPRYARWFAALREEAERALPDATVLRTDPMDAGLVHDAGLDATLATWGGVELAADDGRVVRNTLEERLRRAEPALRRLALRAGEAT